MPGHCKSAVNCKSDEVARSDASVSLAAERKRVGAPLARCGSLLDGWASSELSKRCSAASKYAVERSFWHWVNRKRFSELFALRKVLTGHCLIGIHAVRLKILLGNSFISCLEEDKIESSQHFLLECLAFARSRLIYLGSNTFRHPGKIAEIVVKYLSRFVRGSRRFIEFYYSPPSWGISHLT